MSSDAPVNVYINGALLSSPFTGRFQLRAGEYDLVLTNDASGYRLMQRVRIRAGRTMHVSAALARERPAGDSESQSVRPPP